MSKIRTVLALLKRAFPASLSLLVVPCAFAQTPKEVDSSAGTVRIDALAGKLEHPWGMAFLPSGELLVTERAGRLRILAKSGELSAPLDGVPSVLSRGQGGLLDVALDPDFDENSFVYLSFSEPGGEGASTAIGRGRFHNKKIENFRVIFRQLPKVSGPNHFGGRIVFDSDKNIYLTTGERFKFEPAQDLSNHLGTIVRITREGKAATGNPFTKNKNAKSEIWSYGHRNIEAAAFDPGTGHLWIAEMGPKGGDELNLIKEGANYGWPIVSWGEHYDGKDIPDPPTRPEFADAAKHWTPVISPSGMVFYTGSMFPEWRGSALIGGLSSRALIRVTVDGGSAKEAERLSLKVRVRDVEQAPDGSLYLLTDQSSGSVLRLSRTGG
ncbi:MAG: PQQ-dependent sugar dehydrogenase [Deltaproteobacteria bacterium]|nr:PQQ-dependent sugar dehydrogenase [Deltaproteobacteria bacterium]